MRPYGLPNRVMSELMAKIFESDNLLKYIYYTGKEHEDIDIFSLKRPPSSELIDKHILKIKNFSYLEVAHIYLHEYLNKHLLLS